MDTVVTNTAQFANTQFANTQLPLASQEEQPPVPQDQVSTQQYFSSMSNRADIFTVSPSSLRDLRAVLNGLFVRIRQYCFVKQSASRSLSRWWTGVLGAANTVYFALSGTLRSIRNCARMEAFVDTSVARCFIIPSLVLSYKASLFTPRMLCWFSIPSDIGCRLDSFSYLPPSSGQLLGVCSVAAEGGAWHGWF